MAAPLAVCFVYVKGEKKPLLKCEEFQKNLHNSCCHREAGLCANCSLLLYYKITLAQAASKVNKQYMR